MKPLSSNSTKRAPGSCDPWQQFRVPAGLRVQLINGLSEHQGENRPLCRRPLHSTPGFIHPGAPRPWQLISSTWAQAARSARPSPRPQASRGVREWRRREQRVSSLAAERSGRISSARDHRCPLGRDRLPRGPGRMPAARHEPGPDPVRSSRSSRRGDAPGTATCRSRGSRESPPAEPEDRSTGGVRRR